MKKLLAAIISAIMILSLAAGCGGTQQPNAATGDEAKSMNAADYKNDFEGLCNYFAAYGYINPKADNTYVVMDYKLIGAKAGKKFTAQDIKNTTIEIYEFDTEKKNATADEVIGSVKQNGTFSILELPDVKAVLSDNGKFMMIYNDTSINEEKTEDDNYKHREEVLKKFKEFHK